MTDWTCVGCGTVVKGEAEVCPLCGGTRHENEQMQQKVDARQNRGTPESKPWWDRDLPWFMGFLLLFPPALVVYLLWKLIFQAGRQPLDEHAEAEQPPDVKT